jgi:peroxiredoxin
VTVPPIGTPAPDFTTRNQYGQQLTLSGLRGVPVVLVFYPHAFTGICTAELGEIRDHRVQFEAVSARVLAVSTDTIFSLRVFADRLRLGFELLTDHWPHGAIARSYGVFDSELGCALRGTFVLDTEGRVVWSVVNRIGEARQLSSVLTTLGAA